MFVGIVVGLAVDRLEPLQRQPVKRSLTGRAMDAHIGRTVEPVQSLAIEIRQVDEPEAGPEVAAHVALTRLDLALGLLTTARLAWDGPEGIETRPRTDLLQGV